MREISQTADYALVEWDINIAISDDPLSSSTGRVCQIQASHRDLLACLAGCVADNAPRGFPESTTSPDCPGHMGWLYALLDDLLADASSKLTKEKPLRVKLAGVSVLAETKGFEPLMQLFTAYSLSRGAPSASRSRLQQSVIVAQFLVVCQFANPTFTKPPYACSAQASSSPCRTT